MYLYSFNATDEKTVLEFDLTKLSLLLLFQENVTLIKEINDLRRELKIARTQVHDLETALGVMRKQQFSEVEHSGNPGESRKVSGENQETEKLLDMQKGEIRKLRCQIKELETVINSRPPSGSRLPPVQAVI